MFPNLKTQSITSTNLKTQPNSTSIPSFSSTPLDLNAALTSGGLKILSTPQQKSDVSTTDVTETPPPSGGAATGGGSSSDTDPATAAYYAGLADRLRSFLDVIPATERQGLDRIDDQYNTGASRLNQQFGDTQRDLGIKKEEATADRNKELRGISDNVSNTADSFARLLGLSHSGNSAFAHDFLPDAVSRMGTKQRGAAMDAYGRNERQLDVAGNDAQQQYDNSMFDLGKQRDDSKYDFSSGVEMNKQDLLDKLTQALYNQQLAAGGDAAAVKAAIDPYNQAAVDSMGRLTSLFDKYRNPVLSVAPINVQIPDLEKYTADPLTASLAMPDNSNNSNVYLPALQKKFRALVA